MGMHHLSNKVAVVGVATTAFGNFPARDEYSLASEAFKGALLDSGLTRDSIDGLLICRIPSYVRMGEMLGLNPRWTLELPSHGRMSGIGIIEAALAVASGQAEHVALLYANVGRSRRIAFGGTEMPDIWDLWGYTSPGAAFALMFRRHMELYGTTTRQLAEVSVATRAHAARNPDAVMRTPITVDDHENSRPIVMPLRLLDYCVVVDGAVCLILTTAERAKDLAQPAVLVAGFGGADKFGESRIPLYSSDFFIPSIRRAGESSYAMAGITCDDVDILMCYDNFSPAVLFALEGLGFCEEGESGAFVADGALTKRGGLSVNTDGGHLSNAYMQGWAHSVEAIRQLRGTCGARQIRDCDIVQYVQGTPCSRSIIYTRG